MGFPFLPYYFIVIWTHLIDIVNMSAVLLLSVQRNRNKMDMGNLIRRKQEKIIYWSG